MRTNCFQSSSLLTDKNSVLNLPSWAGIICSIDNGKVVSFFLLDLSVEFDTVDHGILLEVLHNRFSVNDMRISWFRSYLTDRTRSISVIGVQSEQSIVTCIVPQESVHGSIQFISYTEDNNPDVPLQLSASSSVRYSEQQYSANTIDDINTTLEHLCCCILDISWKMVRFILAKLEQLRSDEKIRTPHGFGVSSLLPPTMKMVKTSWSLRQSYSVRDLEEK